MNTYLIQAVLRQANCPLQTIEREVESRVTAETELLARRLFLERAWASGLLVSCVLEVKQIAWRNK